ncbi:hypothetical protein [Stenotrophomonas maltophilia]|uniref:hypothetical protein n=1 Tax=Stenotrophomonas maltophilia TaxID=40324 RepID=UPI003BF7F8FF
MDFSSIATAIASLKSAQELATATLSVRDFNQSAAAIAQINEKLLAAQQGLLAHNTMLLQLQNEHFQTTQELRELKESIAEKNRYLLVDLGGGVFVYRVNSTPQEGGPGQPGLAEPAHYVCQPCLDKGDKAVLQSRNEFWHCPLCRQVYAARGRASHGATFAITDEDGPYRPRGF